jgi:hypothetical protein
LKPGLKVQKLGFSARAPATAFLAAKRGITHEEYAWTSDRPS